MARGQAVACALIVLLAGCVAEGDAQAPPAAPATAEKTAETGGIEGHIITDEIQPISRAQVALHKTNQTTMTGQDGGFAFSLLDPGEYTILAGALGYFEAQKKVTVTASEITRVDIVLDRIPIAAPSFVETFKFEDTLILNDLCPEAPDMTPGAQGVTWQDYPLRINDSKEDGTPLAAVYTFVDLKSQPDAATIDVDLYLIDPKGTQIASSTSSGPNENLTVKKVLPAGDYVVRACLWLGANAHYSIKVEVTYDQGEAALYAREKGKK